MTPEERKEFMDKFNTATSLGDKQAIASEFIDANDKDLSKIKDILVKLCVELNDLDSDNYFFQYIDLFNDVPSRGLMIALNNLYASNIIDDNDLDGSGSEGVNSIIFDKSLSDIDLANDIEFLIKAYYWMSQINNLKKMNVRALNNLAVKEQYTKLQDATNQIISQGGSVDYKLDKVLRDAIIYDDSGKVRTRQDVEKILHAASSVNQEDTFNNRNRNINNVSDALSIIAKMSDAEKNELFQALGINQ